MATKTTADKLQIKPGTAVWFSDKAQASLVGPLPDGVRVVDALGDAAIAVVFVDSAAATRALCDAQRADLAGPAIVWFAYPKGNKADINRDSLWKIVGKYGLRPNSQIAIDETWSALRFRAMREGEEPFTAGATAAV